MALRLRWNMLKAKLILFLLLILSFSLNTAGCGTIGIKEKSRIVYVSFAKTPEELKGALRVATNEPIPVTVVGEEETEAELNLGGYYLVHENDLKAFLNAIRSR
jgi:hypothetical protein